MKFNLLALTLLNAAVQAGTHDSAVVPGCENSIKDMSATAKKEDYVLQSLDSVHTLNHSGNKFYAIQGNQSRRNACPVKECTLRSQGCAREYEGINLNGKNVNGRFEIRTNFILAHGFTETVCIQCKSESYTVNIDNQTYKQGPQPCWTYENHTGVREASVQQVLISTKKAVDLNNDINRIFVGGAVSDGTILKECPIQSCEWRETGCLNKIEGSVLKMENRQILGSSFEAVLDIPAEVCFYCSGKKGDQRYSFMADDISVGKLDESNMLPMVICVFAVALFAGGAFAVLNEQHTSSSNIKPAGGADVEQDFDVLQSVPDSARTNATDQD